jgi:phage FluMu protein Com
MSVTRIICPNCRRILGDTDKSVDCWFNCPSCKKIVNIKIDIKNFIDIPSYEDYIKLKPKEAK